MPNPVTPEDFDIAIVGLGPAGATLARLLPSRYRVAAIDKKRMDGEGFEKPCGGLLADDAQKALAGFGLSIPKSVLADPQIFAVKTLDAVTGRVAYYQRFYLNVDRAAFDRYLISLIPRNVRLLQGTAVDVIQQLEDGRYLLQYENGGARCALTARILVGADGANSAVRHFLYPKRKIRHFVAIQQRFETAEQTPNYACIFDKSTTPSCAWALSKNRQFIFGGAFEAHNCRQQFEKLKTKLVSSGFLFGEPISTQACIVLCPASPLSFCLGTKNAFLIGEAAGFISPSSFEGISFALLSALALANALQTGTDGSKRRYRIHTRKIRLRLTAKMLKRSFLYSQPIRNIVMKSGLKRIRLSGN